ncbi:MAG: AAA family ATPase [endosymbiont of Galathealinum brachiosum]|uniref:AAA family ATPase n=1 Tax=endosymbiont of Galathealinum brachiosum TaxID=2200906 RepID=A0A370DIG4_9GAMM|nr:MAG: AAA family ATPase [endosymbiont of Galathealinum brachiosum]
MPQQSSLNIDQRQQLIKLTSKSISSIILGKDRQIQLALSCLLAGGHLLIEDLPGVGKTTLSLTLARVFGLDFQRIQFTSDLLPSDVLGVSIFDAHKQSFTFHQGPIFTQVLLADEINRSTPKTQSALLEAMEEKQVTQDGVTRTLPTPFFVIATQNPMEQVGTFPLPESQLDRFLMRINIGYPDQQAEMELLKGSNRHEMIQQLETVITPEQLIEIQLSVEKIHMSQAILDYVLSLIRSSRLSPWFISGLSPRAGLALQRCARAWAFLQNRDHVLPEDVQEVLPCVAAHRLQIHPEHQGKNINDLITLLVKQVPV